MRIITKMIRNPQEAFREALENGGLSKDSRSKAYAEHYQYLYSTPNTDSFKNLINEEHVVLPRRPNLSMQKR